MPAVITKGKTFGSTEEVTNTKLHTLVDSATIASIDQTNMDASVGIMETGTSNPSDTDALWKDTSGSPSVVKYHDGSSWTRISPASTISTLDVVTAESTVIASSTSEETSHTFSVPANTFGTNNLLRLNYWGLVLNNSGGSIVVTYRLKYGATTLATVAMTMPTASATPQYLELTALLKGDAATNAQEAVLLVNQVFPGAGTSQREFMAYDDGTSAEDSTGALNLLITAQSDTNNAGISLVKKSVSIEKLEAV